MLILKNLVFDEPLLVISNEGKESLPCLIKMPLRSIGAIA